MSDFIIRNEGSLFMLTPITRDAKTWKSENLPKDALEFGGAVAIEHRYIENIVDGIINDGLTIRRSQ